MSLRRRVALPTIAACLVAAALGSFGLGERTVGDGWLFDLALAARARIWPPSAAASKSEVVVIAVDQRSLDSEALKSVPRALFSPVWAKLVDGLAAAGARVVAFDLLLAYSGNSLQAGYDRDFQRALYRHRERIVLGRSARTLPAKPFLAALEFDPGSLGLLEIVPDADGIFRRLPTRLRGTDGVEVTSLVGAVLGRAGVAVGAGAAPSEFMVAPRRHLEALPSYALVDVLGCLDKAPTSLRGAVEGRIVFIGSVLAEEDRRLPSSRFLPPPVAGEASAVAGCDLPRLGASLPTSHTVAGVYLHAAATEAALTGEHLTLVPRALRVGLTGLAGGLGAALGLVLAPWTAVTLSLLAVLALWGGEVALIEAGLWLPAASAMLAVMAATIVAYLVRYLVEERRRLSIQRAFGRYLAPSLVESLMDDPSALQLGGTVRLITVMFADLSGFTALSTKVGPAELVALTNDYLALISDEVDLSDGYVDKYIGDAVMAIWGAPVPDPENARNAVAAAFRILARIEEAAAEAAARGEPAFGLKIGIYSGEAIVGNVGSERRYNYTAIGETVNIAARMESLPGVYGCSLLVGSTTAVALGDDVTMREIDWVAVKGRAEALTIHEPLAMAAAGGREQGLAAGYAEALALYRARHFVEAAALWEAAGPDDGPARIMAARARDYARTPPPDDWDGAYVMEGK